MREVMASTTCQVVRRGVKNTGMQIRVQNIPDAVHRDLKVWAAQEQITLNDLMLNIIKAAVEKRQGKK